MDYANSLVGKIVTDMPGATAVLFANNINCCAEEEKTLGDIIREKDLDGPSIFSSLDVLTKQKLRFQEFHYYSNRLLIDHILERFHTVHRRQLPELIRLAEQVEKVHVTHNFCPKGLAKHLSDMHEALDLHLQKEILELFPSLSQDFAPLAHSVINAMKIEHDEHLAQIRIIYELTNDMTILPSACAAWKALYLGLEEFIEDINMHIYIENNILFVR